MPRKIGRGRARQVDALASKVVEKWINEGGCQAVPVEEDDGCQDATFFVRSVEPSEEYEREVVVVFRVSGLAIEQYEEAIKP